MSLNVPNMFHQLKSQRFVERHYYPRLVPISILQTGQSKTNYCHIRNLAAQEHILEEFLAEQVTCVFDVVWEWLLMGHLCQGLATREFVPDHVHRVSLPIPVHSHLRHGENMARFSYHSINNQVINHSINHKSIFQSTTKRKLQMHVNLFINHTTIKYTVIIQVGYNLHKTHNIPNSETQPTSLLKVMRATRRLGKDDAISFSWWSMAAWTDCRREMYVTSRRWPGRCWSARSRFISRA